jgi:UPF0755 protein
VKKKLTVGIVFLCFIAGAVISYFYFRLNETVVQQNFTLYIPTGSDQDEVLRILESVEEIEPFTLIPAIAERKNYRGSLVISGKYELSKGMSAPELIDYLRAGNGEEEVRVTFNTLRTLEDLAGKVGAQIESDSISLVNHFLADEVFKKYGFNRDNFKAMFLPDTYSFEWDTSPEEFTQRMASEFKKFWSESRRQKASELGLSQSEVSTLASIVQAEQQSIPEERPRIAGLYLNRLRMGMRLQSDPTVIYALGDFTINRVLTAQLSYDSPYNTYVYAGLPPGPINIPSKQSIDAVLNAEDHKYIYMCAKADFSGYHAFATNLSQHNRNARAFQMALNERKIYR